MNKSSIEVFNMINFNTILAIELTQTTLPNKKL